MPFCTAQLNGGYRETSPKTRRNRHFTDPCPRHPQPKTVPEAANLEDSGRIWGRIWGRIRAGQSGTGATSRRVHRGKIKQPRVGYISEQEIEMSPSGEHNFKIPQQVWTGNDSIQSSYFAGQKMVMARSDENPNVYELHYLGLMVSGFEEIDDAKYNVPKFARSAFQILGEFVKDS